MPYSHDQFLTTHVGSLPRPRAITDFLFAQERDEPVDSSILAPAVIEVVARQKTAGLHIVSDGEMSKISYATYISGRITGFDGDSPRRPPSDLADYPEYLRRLAQQGGTPVYRRPRCVGPVAVRSARPLTDDLTRMARALEKVNVSDSFVNAASPGVIALFHPNDYYQSQDDYLEALADAMQPEYEAIVEAGHILQLDCPDIGLGRHMMFADRNVEDYRAAATRHVEVLNHALRNIPPERMRLHICWGNYEGPHHHDIPMTEVLPIVLKARPQGLVFENANPRHAHEWTVFADAESSGALVDKVLIPGVIDSTTNFVEHPELVAERIERFAAIVGRERVIAGTDCGFSTFAGFGAVDADIVYAKLAALVEGAAIASKRVFSS